MTNEEIHPHTEMANFVNQFEIIVKPNLEKGNLEGLRPIIGELFLRSELIQDLTVSANKGAYGRYKMAIKYLAGLIRAENVNKKTLQDLLTCSDRWVSELDLILNKDPTYKLVRDEVKDYPKSL